MPSSAAVPRAPPLATEWAKRAREWRDLGAIHVSVNTMGSGLAPRDHIDAILKMKNVFDGK